MGIDLIYYFSVVTEQAAVSVSALPGVDRAAVLVQTNSSFSFSEEIGFSEEAAGDDEDDDDDELVVAVTGLTPYCKLSI